MKKDTATTGKKAPTHIAYQVKEGKDKTYFNRIGAVWMHANEKGFNIQLDSLPLDGKIVVLTYEEK